MRRFFNILLGALAMLAVALLSAFLAMRLAIHGREVEVPNVAGLTFAEAHSLASSLGLNMTLENHFYSTATPAGRILSQYPAPGTKVRREWVMRVTESSGPQRVSVPNVVGQTEREASVTIRRLSLDLGTVAYIPSPGPAGMVLAQTPTPAAAGVDGPRISLLVSAPVASARMRQAMAAEGAEDADASQPAENAAPGPTPDLTGASGDQGSASTASAASASADQADAYAMPNVLGLPLAVATARLASMGLHVTSVETAFGEFKPVAPIASPSAPGSGTPGSGTPGAIRPIAPPAPVTLPNTVVSQSPGIGRRVTKTDTIHLVVSH